MLETRNWFPKLQKRCLVIEKLLRNPRRRGWNHYCIELQSNSGSDPLLILGQLSYSIPYLMNKFSNLKCNWILNWMFDVPMEAWHPPWQKALPPTMTPSIVNCHRLCSDTGVQVTSPVKRFESTPPKMISPPGVSSASLKRIVNHSKWK